MTFWKTGLIKFVGKTLLPNIALLQKSISSILLFGKNDKVTDGLPGKPKYIAPAKTLEEVYGLGFFGIKFQKYLESRDEQFVGE